MIIEVSTAAGHRPECAAWGPPNVPRPNREAAIQRFSEAPFDVVLTDLNLGRQNGFDLLRHVLDKAPEVPVVVITGYASIDSAMEAIRAGAYDYLPKPPTLEVMGTVLSRAV